jgi:hypothetical protein
LAGLTNPATPIFGVSRVTRPDKMGQWRSRDYIDLIEKIDTHDARYGELYRFDFDYERDDDDGKGL